MNKSDPTATPNEGTVSVSGTLKEIYAKLDKITEDIREKAKVTCRKGCAHCCELLALATFSEAVLLAEEVWARPDWKDLVDQMRKQALETCFDGITEVKYADKQIPCAFIGEDNACKMYAVRPACCRYHIAISDPKFCSFEFRHETRETIDLKSMEAEVWAFSAHVADTVDLPPFTSGPIPLITLHTMLLIAGEDDGRKYVEKAVEGIPSPLEWMAKYMGTLTGGVGSQTSRVQLP